MKRRDEDADENDDKNYWRPSFVVLIFPSFSALRGSKYAIADTNRGGPQDGVAFLAAQLSRRCSQTSHSR